MRKINHLAKKTDLQKDKSIFKKRFFNLIFLKKNRDLYVMQAAKKEIQNLSE